MSEGTSLTLFVFRGDLHEVLIRLLATLPLILSPNIGSAAMPTGDEIDALVDAVRERWQVPGLALVVVQDDRVVHLKGYGRISLDDKTLVSPDTVFPLASCTKPLTTAILASLVDDGKLAWNDPVGKHLPDFRLKDPLANDRATLRDLLCHRTGLGPHPLLWYQSPLSIEERVRKLALLTPVADFRTEFHYQAVAFAAAGLAAERTAGVPWSKLLQDRLAEPLGMTRTFPVEPRGDVVLAQPHARGRDGVVRAVPRYSLRSPDPAGSAHTTARDLSAFLRMLLATGTFEGKSILSAPRIDDLQQPSMVVPMDAAAQRLNPETVQITYGLGWVVQDFRGRKMILHGGAIDGFRAHLTLLPEARLGIAVLSNLDGALANFALSNSLVDRVLDVPPRDWIGDFAEIEDLERRRDRHRSAMLRKRRPANAQPLAKLTDYVGVFGDDVYGPVEIVIEKDALELRWRSMRSPLEHYTGHLFLADEPPFRDAAVEFVPSPMGAIDEVRILDRAFRRGK